MCIRDRLSAAHRVAIEDVSFFIRADVHSQHIQFAILDFDPSILQIDFACTKTLDLCTDKCNSGLQRFQNKVVMARLAVDGDGF